MMILDEGRIVCPPWTATVSNLIDTDPHEARRLILGHILSSKYKAYTNFLLRLQEIDGHLELEQEIRRQRGMELRTFLTKRGFFTDSASFYTIRDLLYDFGLINWSIKPDATEHIFMASFISKPNIPNSRQFKTSVKTDDLVLFYQKVVDPVQFGNCVLEFYLEMARNNWGQAVSLLDLRDLVTQKLQLSDQDFNDSILASVALTDRLREKVSVELSEGTLQQRTLAGRVPKVMNLPTIRGGGFATYVRILKL